MIEIEEAVSKLPSKPDAVPVVDLVTEAFGHLGAGEDYLAGLRRTVPGVDVVYGVKVPVLRQLASRVLSEYKKDAQVAKLVALEAWERGSREHELLALFLLAGVKLTPEDRWGLGTRLLPDVRHWEACDQLCHALLGQALSEDPKYMAELESWIGAGNLWTRRAALVSTVILRRAKYPPEVLRNLDRRTLAMCAVALDDDRNYIRRAVDWAIREVIKRNYDLGRSWMFDRSTEKLPQTARTTLKLAAKKLRQADEADLVRTLESHS